MGLMALSPSIHLGRLFLPPLTPFSSLSSSSSSSTSLPVIRTRRNPPPTHLNSQRLQTSHSSRTLELPNEEYPEPEPHSSTMKRKKKKERKLRPSFYDQTMERWSIRISSQRSRFPWQEQEAEEEDGKETLSPLTTLCPAPPMVDDGHPPMDQPVSYPSGNRVVSAPWAHGAKPRKTHLGPQAKAQVPSKRVEFKGEGEIGRPGLAVEDLLDESSPVQNSTSFSGSGDEDELDCRDNIHYPSFPMDESPPITRPVGFTLENLAVSAPQIQGAKPRKNTHLDSKAKTQTPLKSLEVCGEGQKSRVGSIIENLNSSLDQNISSFNADSDGEEGFDSEGGIGNFMGSVSVPWERETGDSDGGQLHRRSNTKVADRTVPEPELRRLRNVALRIKEKTKVGPAGVTETVVESIHNKWKEVEVVKLKFEGPPVLHMKRTHEVLERKTGGLVIWRSGSSLVLYRGMTYKLPCMQSYSKHADTKLMLAPFLKDSTINVNGDCEVNSSVRLPKISSAVSMNPSQHPSDRLMDTFDMDSLLDELGPRFRDWSGRNPLPVDADLLPSVVPGYRPPFRLLPYKTKHGLRNGEITYIRRLARTIPPHFALGRNRQHQGLAQAIVKLWEKSVIAKIAIKRGVPNTCNDRMAEEIKKLTGGTLLSRNKEYIVFYRGNDFLIPSITEVLVERQKLASVRQEEEEQARARASDFMVLNTKTPKRSLVAGTLAETLEAKTRWRNQPSSVEREKMMRDLALDKHLSHIRYLEKKLALAQGKVRKAEKALGKVQEFLNPAELPTDLETVTDEERFLFRKIGLKMRTFLSLGRRGVFDGTVENMHLHWKHRELVKIMVQGKSFAQVKHIAISLEAESGGVLISLDKTSKGYAIIVYRGKNYQRPHILRPKTMLTRRQALERSIELQRREALNHHISNLREKVKMLKSELNKMESAKEMSNEEMHSQLDDAFSSDNDVEDEGEEAYLETYNSENEDGDFHVEEL